MTLADIPDDWQHDDLARALRYVTRFGCAYDCGAHRGVTVSYLLTRFAHVVAFEPGPLFHEIDRRAERYKVALGRMDSEGAMEDGKHNTGQRHMVPGLGVPICPLWRFAHHHVDFIKIDVEGMELDVIRGGREMILRDRPVVMIEENGLSERYGVARGETGAYLEAMGMTRVLVTRKGSDEDWTYAFA